MASPLRQQENKRLYETQASCAQVLADLREPSERRRGLWVVGVIVGAALIVVVCITLRVDGAWLWPAFGSFFVAFVLFLLFKDTFGGDTLDDRAASHRRKALVTQVVSLLQADISSEEPLNIRLDLRAENHADKLARKSQSPSGWAVRHYVEPMAQPPRPAARGHALPVGHDRSPRRAQPVERTAAGAASSTRGRSARVPWCGVRLRVKPERYAHLPRLREQARDAVRLPEGTRLKALDVEADRLDLTVLLHVPWVGYPEEEQVALVGSQVVAMALLSLFHILHLSRALDKKARLAG